MQGASGQKGPGEIQEDQADDTFVYFIPIPVPLVQDKCHMHPVPKVWCVQSCSSAVYTR